MSTGTVLRDVALIRVEDANRVFVEAAYQLIKMLSVNKREFTSDDVWAYIVKGSGVEPRAMGPAFMRAAKKGYIRKTGRTVPSTRPVCHAGPKTVWRSCLL